MDAHSTAYYEKAFTNCDHLLILGSEHHLGTPSLSIDPPIYKMVTVHPSTYDVTVFFDKPCSGIITLRVVLPLPQGGPMTDIPSPWTTHIYSEPFVMTYELRIPQSHHHLKVGAPVLWQCFSDETPPRVLDFGNVDYALDRDTGEFWLFLWKPFPAPIRGTIVLTGILEEGHSDAPLEEGSVYTATYDASGPVLDTDAVQVDAITGEVVVKMRDGTTQRIMPREQEH